MWIVSSWTPSLALGQSGGWPLNMFATPQGEPITGGTYFPPQDAHGRRGFFSVLETIHQAWQEQRADMLENARLLTLHLQRHGESKAGPSGDWDYSLEEKTAAQYKKYYDPHHGGFLLQDPQKFPNTMGLQFLLRYHVRSGDAHALEIVQQSIKQMLAGGIYDQLGGGLCRYSTDRRWLVPHFEKMLYDNALFAQLLLEVHQLSGRAFYSMYAQDVLDYALRDLRHGEGAFGSAEDADSEGEEGRFYTWHSAEWEGVLTAEQRALARDYWGVSEAGHLAGRSILHVARPLAELARAHGLDDDTLAERLSEVREILWQLRAERERPLFDDKVLTSWNALMITALAKGAVICGRDDYLAAAKETAHFLLTRLRRPDGRLLRRYRDGDARHLAYLVDYAQLGCACLDLYEASFELHWFEAAVALADQINDLFIQTDGAYLDVGHDAAQLAVRSAQGYDSVEPSGNSATASLLLRLHAYGLAGGYEEHALRIFSTFRGLLDRAGMSFAAMLQALQFHLAPPLEVAVVGESTAADTQRLLALARTQFLPQQVLAYAAPAALADAASRIPLLRGRHMQAGQATAYVCREQRCALPTSDAETFKRQLGLP